MTPGYVFSLDTRLPHWTTEGRAVLICAALEFTEKPSEEDIHYFFDQKVANFLAEENPVCPFTHNLTNRITNFPKS